jgi:hypothetical protein
MKLLAAVRLLAVAELSQHRNYRSWDRCLMVQQARKGKRETKKTQRVSNLVRMAKVDLGHAKA